MTRTSDQSFQGACSRVRLQYQELNAERPELVGLDPLAAVVAPGMAAHLTVLATQSDILIMLLHSAR